ncbi:hypothetical protein BD770DRAFT_311575 [Pilaira anomala]|nr:hypothetical protein BD770DRAFT_311575 [Pilaira anomala]
MQEREFQNMFIFAKGFEAASLKWHCKDQQEDQDMCHSTLNHKKQMIGFARFHTRLEAIEAVNEINGKKIDMEKGCILKAEMAKKNLHIKRTIIPSATTSTTTSSSTTIMLPPAVLLPEHTTATNTSIPSNIITTNSANQNPPCNTLYVGNLPPSTNEDELRLLFEKCEGYKRMCFRNKPQGPMCFVEFEGVEYAAHAMNEHQGHLLSNSIKGGIRLSFSKNPLFIKPTKGGDISFNFKQMGTALLADL